MAAFSIKSYDEWIKLTKVSLKPRSKELDALDLQLKAYFGPGGDLKWIGERFATWCQLKDNAGRKWQNGARNHSGAMTELDKWLHPESYARVQLRLSPAEIAAFKLIDQENQNMLNILFANATFEYKATTVVGVTAKVAAAASGISNLKSRGKTPTNADVSLGKDLLVKVAGPAAPQIAGMFAKMVPILNIIATSATLVHAIYKVVDIHLTAGKIKDARFAIADGDPEAALESVERLLARQAKLAKSNAARSAVGFAAALVGPITAGVAGIAAGTALAVAELLETLYVQGRELEEFKAGKDALQRGTLTFKVFEECPLLGAYYLTCSNTSTIVAMAVHDYGQPNWQYEVEGLVQRTQIIRDTARGMIRSSIHQVVGITQNFGAIPDTKKGLIMGYGPRLGVLDKLDDAINEAARKKPVAA